MCRFSPHWTSISPPLQLVAPRVSLDWTTALAWTSRRDFFEDPLYEPRGQHLARRDNATQRIFRRSFSGKPERPPANAARPFDHATIVNVNAAEARRLARAQWPIRKIALEEEGADDPRDASTVDDRVALVWKLTREAWSLQGRELPSYPRSEAPGRILRPR